MRPIHGCPKNCWDSLTMPMATFPKIFHGLLFWLTLWMCVKNLKSVALPIPEIIGGTQKIWAVTGYAHAPFSKMFNWLQFGCILWTYLPNLKSVALPVPELIWGSQKIGVVPGYVNTLYSPPPPHTKNSYMPTVQTMCTHFPQFLIAVLSEVTNPQSWGRGDRRGSVMVPFERALVSSYRPSIVTFPLGKTIVSEQHQY